MSLVLIIVIILLILENDKKNKEIFSLKKQAENKNNINFCPKCGYDLNKETNKITQIKTETNSTTINTNINKELTHIEKQENTEIKNSWVLITGAILIILSAIVFLTATWNITHSFIKTIVIILMFIVFEGVSKIAKEKNLKQTSTTFHYIALAYIPIMFISIFFFGNLGEILRINKEIRSIYLTIASAVLTIIYYYDYKKDKSNIVASASIISSILAVICFTTIFSSELNYHIISLIIYTIIIGLLYLKDIFIFNEKIHKTTIEILFFALLILAFRNNIVLIIDNKINIINAIIPILFIANTYIYIYKINNNKKDFNILYPIFFIVSAINMTFLFEAFIIKQIIILGSVLAINFISLILNEKIENSTLIETLVIMTILYISSTITEEFFIIPNYLIIITQTILLWMTYLYSNDKKLLAQISTIGIILSLLNIIITNQIDLIMFGLSSIILIIASSFIKVKEIKDSFKSISIITFILFSITYYNNSIFLILLYIIFIILTFIQGYKEEDIIKKIISYIYLNPLILLIMAYLNIDITFYILCTPLSAIIITILELTLPKLKTEENSYYIILNYILSIIILAIINHTIFNFIYLILINILYIIYLNNKKEILYYIIPLISPIFYIHSDILIINNINYMYVVSTSLILFTLYLCYKKKNEILYSIFYIYAFSHFIAFNDIKYYKLLILLLGTTIIYSSAIKRKDLYKTIIYILSYCIMKTFIIDLNLEKIAAINYGTILLFITLISRDIAKKYMPDYKILIYIGYIITNFSAFANYSSEQDGILFIFLLTFYVLISYTYKFGPEFITSIIFILLNVLILTRTFWLNIPWYLYILLVGSILIGFAIKNEATENKTNSKKRLEELKKHLDL